MLISEAASQTGLTISNIRFYERKNLLEPERNSNGKYRNYSKSDIERLKKIILYRKMGMSIEIINKLLKHELSLKEALSKQIEELIDQQKELEGSIDLCKKLITENTDDVNVDYYLSYVTNEEAHGKKFANVEELLEDVSEYWKLDTLRYNPYLGKLYYNKNIFYSLIIASIIIGLGIPIVNVIAIINGNSTNKLMILVWIAYIAYLIISFAKYRKKRRK